MGAARRGYSTVQAGAGEPDWAIPWQHATGPEGNAIVQSSVVSEGDGALQVSGGTTAVYRDWAPAQPTGVVTVSQMIYVPAGGGLQQYLQDGTGPNVETATAAQWMAAAGQNFGVLDSGVWEDTGIPVAVGAWTEVTVR